MYQTTLIAVGIAACFAASSARAQQTPQSTQPTGGTGAAESAATPQGGTQLDGSVVPGPNIGQDATSIPPTTPGTSPFEGAQPGQTGSAEAIRQGGPRERAPIPSQPFETQQRINQFNHQQLQHQRFGAENSLHEGAVGAPDKLSRRSQTSANRRNFLRGTAREEQRSFIANDLRARGLQGDDWRVVLHNGRWWFYTPQQSWLYFDNRGNWTAHRPGAIERQRFVGRPPVGYPNGHPADDWRLVRHNNRWWFWTPENTWLYHDRGRWMTLQNRGDSMARDRQLERQSVGYRGVDEALETSRDTDSRATAEQPSLEATPPAMNDANPIDAEESPLIPSSTEPLRQTPALPSNSTDLTDPLDQQTQP